MNELTILDEANFAPALRYLADRDSDLAAILERLGPPPLWQREPGFATLVHIILEQQVSLASARAAFERLRATVSPLTPAGLLELDDSQLKAIGFSRQKTAYARDLSRAMLEGRLDVERLATLGDEAVRSELVKIKGIGNWTVDVYLLMALRRANAWPKGDLALLVAAQQVKKLPARPTPDQLEELARPWQPWRAVAAHLLWHHYLNPA